MTCNRIKVMQFRYNDQNDILSDKSVNLLLLIKVKFVSRTPYKQDVFILKRGLRAR